MFTILKQCFINNFVRYLAKTELLIETDAIYNWNFNGKNALFKTLVLRFSQNMHILKMHSP